MVDLRSKRSIAPDTGANPVALEDFKLPEDRRAPEPRTATVQKPTTVATKTAGTPIYRHRDQMDRFFGM